MSLVAVREAALEVVAAPPGADDFQNPNMTRLLELLDEYEDGSDEDVLRSAGVPAALEDDEKGTTFFMLTTLVLLTRIKRREKEFAAEREAIRREFAAEADRMEQEYRDAVAAMAEGAPERKWDTDAILADKPDANMKLSIRWPDGSGESVWALALGDGFAMLFNSPLYPKYRFRDIVMHRSNYAGPVVHRTFPTHLVIEYEVAEDQDKHQADRSQIVEALKPIAWPGFFTDGHAYAYLRAGTDPVEVKAAAEGCGVRIIKVQEQRFDVEADEYSYLEVD